MMRKAWSGIEEMPYCFSRSSVKFQGHIALKIVEFNPNWAFPDCNSRLNSPMAMKCCTKLETAKKRCPIVFQGQPSNFTVTRDKTSQILTQIGRFQTIVRSQLSNPSDLPCSFLMTLPDQSDLVTMLFTRGQFWPSGIVITCVCGSVCVCMCVYQSRACPLDNSSSSQARITKFGPEMQNTLVWVPIVFGDDRPWSSRSNLTWKSNFTSFWACSHHYSSAIQARISKFGPKMHLSTVKIPTNFGLDWFWSSLSFSILKPIFSTKFICALFVCIYLVRLVACKY